MTYLLDTLTIKAWAEEDRPREKLQQKGHQLLSDAELLAILLRTGSRKETAVDLAKRLLRAVDHDLRELGRQRPLDLIQFKGMGMAKAITVIAALELGRRRQLAEVRDRPQVKSSKEAYLLLAPILSDLDHEEFWILLLDRSSRLIGRERISMGGVSGTVVDARLIFRRAVEGLASSVILCHNHPSGSLKPSGADVQITRKIKKAGVHLDILVCDHLIISERGYFSFADEGMI
ncbi:MAG: DNA repair protein RadC [Bacteroidota bacterium]